MKSMGMKLIVLLAAVLAVHSAAYAQSQVMRGEIAAGSYGNVKTDSSGYLYVTTVGTGATTATISPTAGTVTDRSGTITLGGSAQTIMAANATRKYLMIQNVSDTTMWCNFTTTAVANQPSIQLIAGASFTMEGSSITTELISCIGATTGKAFTAKEM